MPNSKDLLNDMKKHTLDGVPYYPRDELPSAVDDAADVMSKYKKAVSEHEAKNEEVSKDMERKRLPLEEKMKISKEGIALIKKFEGIELQAYQDSVGVWTIGYGHTKRSQRRR